MSKNLRVASAAVGVAAASLTLFGAEKRAPAQAEGGTPACNSFAGGNVVYIAGSSASKPVLQALATTLSLRGSTIGIIYQAPDSCQGVSDLLNTTGDTASALYLNGSNGTTTACDIRNGGSTPAIVDIAVSDVYPATCAANSLAPALTTSQKDILGPIQSMTFSVPTGSTSGGVISAAAAYVVFGCAGGAPGSSCSLTVAPWTNQASIFVRAHTSGTLNMLGSAIGLSPSKWPTANPVDGGTPATQAGGTGAMQGDIANGDPTTIGILSDEGALAWNANSSNTNKIKVLAYQHTGQSCGYFPDSTATASDKINVRQGRYAVWGPLHFIVNVDASSHPLGGDQSATNAAKIQSVTTVLNYFIATGPNPTQTWSNDAGPPITDADKLSLVKTEIGDLSAAIGSRGYVVPWCAMQVQRSGEVSPNAMSGESSYQPPEPCGCFFEKVATGATTSSYCHACATNDDCHNPDGGTSAYPVCRWIDSANGNMGYCEAQ
jgi:ABC-type phosphate transport system substrate-binding protein